MAAAIPLAALLLGLGGVLPFVALSTLMHLVPQPNLKYFISRSLISYAAVVLSFLGGTRWGLALRASTRRLQAIHLLIAVVPSILAWALATARIDTAIAGFAVLFAVLGLVDAVSLQPLSGSGLVRPAEGAAVDPRGNVRWSRRCLPSDRPYEIFQSPICSKAALQRAWIGNQGTMLRSI